jgi:high-affinity K+ transport system ATPase subunit B
VQAAGSRLNGAYNVKEKFRPDSLPHSKNATLPWRPVVLSRWMSSEYAVSESAMTVRNARLAPLLLLAVLAAAAGDAMAQGRGQGRGNGGNSERNEPAVRLDDRRGHDRREDHRELSDAVRRVERRTGGQVLSAERVPFDGRDVNRVKVVDSSGRVRIYMDDPSSRGRDDGARRTRRDDSDND